MPGGGPRRAPGIIPILECVRLDRIAPFMGGRCGGAEDILGGGWPITEAGGESPGRGLVWFTTLTWWSMAYIASMRGTGTLDSVASLMGDPKKVSTSIGRRAWKSWNIVLGASDAIIFSIVFSRKSLENLQPCAPASSRSSSITPFTNWRTPAFSSSCVGLGVSKTTLAVWNAIGLQRR